MILTYIKKPNTLTLPNMVTGHTKKALCDIEKCTLIQILLIPAWIASITIKSLWQKNQ